MFDDGMKAAVFADNILDRRYSIDNPGLSSALGIANQAYARPRWMIASLIVRFD